LAKYFLREKGQRWAPVPANLPVLRQLADHFLKVQRLLTKIKNGLATDLYFGAGERTCTLYAFALAKAALKAKQGKH